ncbi:hypothetical protein RJ55_01455 [Drechmeria coniospora]|nr:hypothetical protein RJ55_01455 [Drechmeria coniospora]
MARLEGMTPLASPGQSRRPSVLVPRDDDGPNENHDGAAKRLELELERDKAAARSRALSRSIARLNTFSTDMTKRLDDTYYAVLEKTSTLHSTVMALKDLAQSSRDIYDSFDKDSRHLESDVAGQLVAIGRFEGHERRISDLQSRISNGRAKIEALTSRVDVVRERIERWERADRAWQERTRKKLKIIWSVTSVVTIVVIALVVGINYARTELDEPHHRGSDSAMASSWYAISNTSGPSTEVVGESGRSLLWKTPLDDGEHLRAFDEL